MNGAFAPAHLKFNLASLSFHQNSTWYGSDGPMTPLEAEMKHATKVGLGPLELDVWTVGFGADGTDTLLGYCYPPELYPTYPALDGCTIQFGTVTGLPEEVKQKGSELGYTLVHEIGHWAGLYHTFNGVS